jgi:hypothetical protein
LGYSDIKISVMKKLVYFFIAVLFLLSCTATKETGSERKQKRLEKKLAEQEIVKKAVESRRYIIRMNKIFMTGGYGVDLVPRSNYIIIDGDIASVSLAYIGRSFTSRPISGINFNGHTIKYAMKNDESKGVYNIDLRVEKSSDIFDLYISIGSEGYCSVSINNANIQSVSYRGILVPVHEKKKAEDQKAVSLPIKI